MNPPSCSLSGCGSRGRTFGGSLLRVTRRVDGGQMSHGADSGDKKSVRHTYFSVIKQVFGTLLNRGFGN